jgi:Flavin-binding monooxygenase-like
MMNKRIAVIGAGCSGIAAVRQLTAAGHTNLVCYEKNDQIGGNWVYTAAPDAHSSVCETTHIISSKHLSQYREFPMPDHYSDYPSHREVLAYFQAYVRTFDLEPYIRFGTSVEMAAPLPDQRWQLRLSDGSIEVFDYLVVANGHHSVPRHPAWAKDFTGDYRHSHNFKNNHDYAGKRVLVVGAGNSGCDCAVESSRVAERVDISLRSAQYIVPKFFMGRPTDTFAAKMMWLPRPVQDFLHGMSLRIQVGRYSDYGLPEPDFPVTRAHPTVNSELLDRIRHGKVHPRTGIARIEGQTVYFTDGTHDTYDAIIAATGYRTAMPFFDRELIDWSDATNVPLYLRMFHPTLQTLFFVGLVQPQGSVWPLSEAQARLLGQYLNGRWQLPKDWPLLAAAEGDRIERHYTKSPRHAVEVPFLQYLRQLERLAGV